MLLSMAHSRYRYITSDLKKALAYSPLVGVLGHRQVGKTTLCSEIGHNYLTFDKKDLLEVAYKDPESLIKKNSKKLTVFDECQLAPPLFPALKEWVRVHKKPSQFLLTGSVRFSSRRAIRESLTGRILNLELLPMSISEIQHRECPSSLSKLMSANHLSSFADHQQATLKNTQRLLDEIPLYLERGGLPGICFTRDSSMREKKLNDLVALILDRDLRQIHETQLSVQEIFEFMHFLADNEGRPINYSEAARKVRISDATQKKLLYALEAIFVLRPVNIGGGSKSKTYYFEDQAEYLFFRKNKDPMQELEGLLYRHLRIHFHYGLQKKYTVAQHLTRGKSRVPFVIEQDNKKLGLLLIEGDKPTLAEKQAGNTFLRISPNGKMIFVSPEKINFDILDERSLIAPLHWIL